MDQFLVQFFVFVAASVVAVPFAKKLGLGSVLGYLIAGIVIGPFGLSLIADIDAVMHFTEFGVVMMLFLVGLELKPSMLKEMKSSIIGMGGLQVLFSTLLIGGVAFYFLPWQQSLAVGLTLSLSSTAIVLQTLREKSLMETTPGRSIFSVLLFQDLAVIPMLAVIPLLATLDLHHDDHGEAALFDIAQLPGYLQITLTLCAILVIFFLAKFASRPLFRSIASTHIREIFVAAALAIVVGISLLMSLVGLSPALGTFLAGVVLAESEYRHELESDIEPFKGLLLGIFFISIGASLNFTLITDQITLIAALTLGLLVLKSIALLLTTIFFPMKGKERGLFVIALAQGGEFGFVLFQLTRSAGVLSQDIIDPLISAVVLSMFLAPLLFLLNDLISKPLEKEESGRPDDEIDHTGHRVILAGFGRLGLDVGRFLISSGIKPVIIDYDETNIDVLREFGFEVYYGDITRPDILEAAGAAEAELLIITIGNLEKSKKLINIIEQHYPSLKVIVMSKDNHGTYELMDMGVKNIRKETFGSALLIGQDALEQLGYDPYEAYRLMRIFRKHAYEILPELYRTYCVDRESYISEHQQQMVNLEEMMSRDLCLECEDEFEKAWIAKNPED